MAIIFDLDQTLIDSNAAGTLRSQRQWPSVYQLIPQFVLYDGIAVVLEQLHVKSIPYAIVTSSPAVYCTKVCHHWGFQPAHIIGYHDTVQRKPHPEPILLALKKLQTAPGKTFSFGDKAMDIVSSNAANVPSVACLWGSEEKEVMLAAHPTFVINRPGEILEIIQANL